MGWGGGGALDWSVGEYSSCLGWGGGWEGGFSRHKAPKTGPNRPARERRALRQYSGSKAVRGDRRGISRVAAGSRLGGP